MSIFDVDYINVVWKLLVPPDKRLPKWLAWGKAVMKGKQWKGYTFFKGYMLGAQYLEPSLSPAANAYNPATAYNSGNRIIYLVQAGGAYYGDNAVYEALHINADGSIDISAMPPGVAPVGNNIAPSAAPATIINSTEAINWLYNYSVNYPVWQPQSYIAGQIVTYAIDGNAYLCISDATSSQNPLTYPANWQFYGSPGCLWVKVSGNFIGANERASYSCQKTIYEYALNKWFNTTFREPLTADTSDSGSDIFITNNTLSTNNFYFFPITTGANYFLPATNISNRTMPFSKYFFPSNVFTQQYDFSINIPYAIYNNLDNETPITAGHNTLKRDAVVKAFADLLCPAGAFYNIITY